MKQSIEKLSAWSLALAIMATPYTARTHGEDKPGPHGGVIRMPGAFHTEVKAEPGAVRVYLLDIGFKNPTIKDSFVDVRIRHGKRESSPIGCKAAGDSFKCDLPKGETLNAGELVVKANRSGSQANDAIYELPLRGGSANSHEAGRH